MKKTKPKEKKIVERCKYGHAWRLEGWEEQKGNKDNLIWVALYCRECGICCKVNSKLK